VGTARTLKSLPTHAQHILAAAGPCSCLLSRQSQYGRPPRYRYRLGHPVLRHSTCYLTLPRRSCAPAFAATPPLQRLHAPVFAATHLLGGLALQCWLPHTFTAGSRSSVGCHPTYLAGSHFSICCFSTSPTAATSAPFKLNDTATEFNECTRFSLLTSCVLCLSISLVRLLLLADGIDGSPMGVVWQRGAYKTCSVKAH